MLAGGPVIKDISNKDSDIFSMKSRMQGFSTGMDHIALIGSTGTWRSTSTRSSAAQFPRER